MKQLQSGIFITTEAGPYTLREDDRGALRARSSVQSQPSRGENHRPGGCPGRTKPPPTRLRCWPLCASSLLIAYDKELAKWHGQRLHLHRPLRQTTSHQHRKNVDCLARLRSLREHQRHLVQETLSSSPFSKRCGGNSRRFNSQAHPWYKKYGIQPRSPTMSEILWQLAKTVALALIDALQGQSDPPSSSNGSNKK